MTFNQFLSGTLSDIKIELMDEFDRSFEKKSFFGTPWAPVKQFNAKGSLMLREGHLRRSIAADIQGSAIRFSSSLPYASIHNEGGTIQMEITDRQRAFFWAKYRELKEDSPDAADRWKFLALKKGTLTIPIPQRQFLGHHPEGDKIIRRVIDKNVFAMLESVRRKN